MNGDNQQPQPTATGPSSAGNGKAAVIDKIRTSTNILVAVSANPSVDQLSSAIALTLMLEKYKKNATAVFSGKVPKALEFLKPGETFEKNTDSLRDFIIALDKSKADKLRYKVEDDVVKIFITPYKTSITEKDLQYNAGDFNVDVIIALGVHHQQDLDTAITAHGRIFHDAVVISINNTSGGDFGIANWEDFEASSLSEVIANLANELSPGLLDAEVATALLTGIVAETSRFSNAKTHPGTMTTSSILLQAGADQTLVNNQLQSLIGTVVNLEAGAEIKPTMTREELQSSEQSVEDELVIGQDGMLQLGNDDSSESSKKSSNTPKLSNANNNSSETKQDQNPNNSKPDSSKPTGLNDAPDDLVLPELDNSKSKDTTQSARGDADNAFGAYEETGTGVAAIVPVAPEDLPAGPLPDVQPGPGSASVDPPVQSAPDPFQSDATQFVPGTLIPTTPLEAFDHSEPVSAGFAPTAPPTAVQSTVPLNQEQAPLKMSPADQPFTMPMPPNSSMSQPQPAVQNTSQGGSNDQTPPPLPPPMMPPSFGGSGR